MITEENKSSLTAVVTGGGSGIGEAVALALAEAGPAVAILGRDAAKLDAVAAKHANITGHACDIADRGKLEATLADIGRVDIVVSCAGVNIAERSMEAVSAESWDFLMEVNATGAFDVMRCVMPGMRERKSGLVVNVCSLSAKRPGPLGGVAYNASKYAMAGLGLTAGEEDKENGIRVSTVYPGEVETPILDKRPKPVSKEHRARILQPSDVAAAVMLIATLPPRAHIPELVIKPTTQTYV
ncbi:MAG: SDR family NAD(P)-dependent oxidoreductase [Planctomycetota bacterium]